jgi:hypothetical protein
MHPTQAQTPLRPLLQTPPGTAMGRCVLVSVRGMGSWLHGGPPATGRVGSSRALALSGGACGYEPRYGAGGAVLCAPPCNGAVLMPWGLATCGLKHTVLPTCSLYCPGVGSGPACPRVGATANCSDRRLAILNSTTTVKQFATQPCGFEGRPQQCGCGIQLIQTDWRHIHPLRVW